jgi:glucosyl-dolichyl phosphate glucuronosyltransferase
MDTRRRLPAEPAPDRRAHDPVIDVSVVICASADERFDDLVAATASVQAQTVRPRETIVVVDHNPSLAARVRERIAEVVVKENLGARGVSTTRNTGVAAARGAVVAFLDDDAIAAPDWLERMLHAYQETSVMAVGGAIEPLWETGRPAWFPPEFGWVVGCSYTGLPDRPATVRNVIGTNMSFRSDVFEAIGGFDSAIGRVGRLPVGCDETELCVRAHHRWPERTIVYDPHILVSHRVPARRTRVAYFLSRCYGEGRSKALISGRVGSRDALSTELRYVTRVLPAGVARGLRDTLAGDPSGVGRSAAILAGLAVTSIGFLSARIAHLSGRVTRPHRRGGD